MSFWDELPWMNRQQAIRGQMVGVSGSDTLGLRCFCAAVCAPPLLCTLQVRAKAGHGTLGQRLWQHSRHTLDCWNEAEHWGWRQCKFWS